MVTHPVQADLCVPVARSEVGFGLRGGALGRGSVTHALMSALRLLTTLLVPALVGALGPAAGALTRTAHTPHIQLHTSHIMLRYFTIGTHICSNLAWHGF